MENYEQTNEVFEALMELMSLLPEPTVTMLNPIRYRAMMQAVSDLKGLLADEYDTGEICVQVDEKFRMGAVSVELDALSISNVPKFQKALSEADCFEVYPLTNGRLRVELTFQGVLNAMY